MRRLCCPAFGAASEVISRACSPRPTKISGGVRASILLAFGVLTGISLPLSLYLNSSKPGLATEARRKAEVRQVELAAVCLLPSAFCLLHLRAPVSPRQFFRF